MAQTESGGRSRILATGLATTVIGAVAGGIGLVVDPERTLQAYLVGFASVASIVAGALAFLMIVHAMRAEWPVAIRRLVEHVAGIAPLLFVLVLPILLGTSRIYPWSNAALARDDIHEAVAHLGGWFGPAFFALRTGIYLLVWTGLALLLGAWSRKLDHDGDPRWLEKAATLSGVGLVALGFTLTWAAFDWLMSLQLPWRSSVFGLYFFSGGFLASFAAIVLLMGGARHGELSAVLRVGHFVSMGKLLLTCVALWTYLFFSQFFLIWIANLPEEVTWWQPRMGAWGPASIVLVVGHFALPLLLLLFRELKERPRALATIAVWILVMHVLDMYWLVMPSLHPDSSQVRWPDVLVPLLAIGPSLAFGAWRARGVSLVATRDPRWKRAIEYEGS